MKYAKKYGVSRASRKYDQSHSHKETPKRTNRMPYPGQHVQIKGKAVTPFAFFPLPNACVLDRHLLFGKIISPLADFVNGLSLPFREGFFKHFFRATAPGNWGFRKSLHTDEQKSNRGSAR